jgi:hypothetical protein
VFPRFCFEMYTLSSSPPSCRPLHGNYNCLRLSLSQGWLALECDVGLLEPRKLFEDQSVASFSVAVVPCCGCPIVYRSLVVVKTCGSFSLWYLGCGVAMDFHPVVSISMASTHSGFPIGAPTSYPSFFLLLVCFCWDVWSLNVVFLLRN